MQRNSLFASVEEKSSKQNSLCHSLLINFMNTNVGANIVHVCMFSLTKNQLLEPYNMRDSGFANVKPDR
jgi:hypothetical protein